MKRVDNILHKKIGVRRSKKRKSFRKKNMKRKAIFLLVAVICGALFSIAMRAQGLRATSFEVKKNGEYSEYDGGNLYINVGGKRQMIAEQANDVWIINGGREVVYSSRDGAGGFENEGQSLRIYDVATGKTRKIMAQYYMIAGLSEVKLSNGRIALLVRMEDGGLGGSYFSVVDPQRGEVFFRAWAEIAAVKNDAITLFFYKESDWETINQARDASYYENKNAFPAARAKAKPSKREVHDLKKILKNKVITNKPTNEYLEAGLRRVKLYLWRVNDNEPNKNFILGTVEREVASAAPLRPTLEELFAGATKDETEKGFGAVAFGMKFEGVSLKNGTATVKFSQPANETNYGTLGSFIFQEAIEKTAKQFPTVKRVVICAVGETLFDAQMDKPFPKCK